MECDFSRGPAQEFSDEILNFMIDLAKEGDRAAVIGGAARVDVALEHLKSVMHHHPGGSDNLFDPDRALGTFSAKINLAYRLGLIDTEAERALQMIRKIRDEFAHAVTHVRLSQPEHVNRVRELSKCTETYAPTFIPKLRDDSLELFGNSDLLTSFCVSLWVATLLLENAALKNTPFRAKSVAILNRSRVPAEE